MEITTDKYESPVGGTIVIPPRRRLRIPRTVAWLAVTPLAAWAVVWLTGLESGSFVTQLMTGTPYAAAGSLIPLLIAVLSGNRKVMAVALATSVTLGWAVLPRAFGSAADPASGRPLKVLSVNLLFGRAEPAAVIDLVRRLDPDVISAQELTPGAVEKLDAAGLATLMPHRYLQDEWSAGGAGLYAKYPLTPRANLFQPIGHNMPAAALALPGGAPVEIVNVHPYPPLGSQIHEWTAAIDALPGAGRGPIRILAGDFNASLDHAPLRRLLGRGYVDAADAVGEGLTPTWPANRRTPPIITIDHVLADERAGVVDVSIHTIAGTDHRAVFADLRVPSSR